MMPARPRPQDGMAPRPDDELVALARRGSEAAVRTLIARHNRQLFRTARGVVRDDAEAEDIVQAAYMRAFTSLDQFRGEAGFATWLTRIVVNEALGRIRRQRRQVTLDDLAAEPAPDQGGAVIYTLTPPAPNPEGETGRAEIRRFLEQAIDRLPDTFRPTYILRDVQGLSQAEVADALGIEVDTVKTRLFRARRLLRRDIATSLGPAFSDLFPFDGERCASMADRVVRGLRSASGRLPGGCGRP